MQKSSDRKDLYCMLENHCRKDMKGFSSNQDFMISQCIFEIDIDYQCGESKMTNGPRRFEEWDSFLQN